MKKGYLKDLIKVYDEIKDQERKDKLIETIESIGWLAILIFLMTWVTIFGLIAHALGI